MCTYEDLVDATLPHGLIPLVVPQLRTITLGGAVTGLGIESTSFRNGLPHESVLEMDVFTGAGEVVTATARTTDLFDAFPNSYGSLGYATRLRIELERVPAYVALRHVRFDDAGLLAKTIAEIVETGEYDGRAGRRPRRRRVRAGRVLPDPGARWTDDARGWQPTERLHRPADLLPVAPAARDRPADDVRLPLALGHRLVLVLRAPSAPSNPLVRRLWPRRWRRSDVYHRLLGLDRRFGIADRLDRRAGPPAARAGDPGRRGAGRAAGGVPRLVRRRGRDAPGLAVPARGASRDAGRPTRSSRGATYVNVGFWGTVHVGPDAADGPRTARSRRRSHELGGHKSLYSEAFYDRETFDRLYDGRQPAAVKARYDPDDRLTTLYDKAVKRR